MKICMITTSFPRSLEDYSGIFIFRLCRALVSSGVDIDVVAPADQKSDSFQLLGECPVHRFSYFFPKRWQKLAYGPGGIPANLKQSPWLLVMVPFFLLFFFLKAYRVSRKANLIHAHWIYSGLIAWGVGLLRGIPFVVTLRGSDVVRAQKRGLSGFVSGWILRRAARVTTVNENLRDWVTAEGIPEERVICIRNGVELNERKRRDASSSPCRFLFVGNIVSAKGIQHLIEAIVLVLKEEKEVRLTLVGEGAERTFMEQRIREKGIEAFVDFVGGQPPDQIASWMSQSDCLVLPSLSEGTPNVILEAMASALPVVASSLPGICEIVNDRVTGLLVKPGDINDLAQKLLEMTRNRDLRRRMGETGRRIISEMGLGWDPVALRYKEVYQELCAASQESSI